MGVCRILRLSQKKKKSLNLPARAAMKEEEINPEEQWSNISCSLPA